MIENHIILGSLKEEDQAPSTNEFARIYQINPATARKGLNLLVDEGILYKKRGLGMFVAEGARQKILMKRQVSFLADTLPEVIREANRLEIDIKELIGHIKELGGEKC
ncbi:MAG: GntR family transcriptional regulator [Epulopiscium sp.]|nr:GntR family transcriptional regulator [Candidatus Epulonipiscium sp.]